MSDKDKEQSVTDFQSGKKKVCVLNMIAGGVGITLTKASDMIVCDYDWTPSNMSQVEDRINRAGQKSQCTIHYIYCENSVLDNLFMEMITSKSENIDKVIDGKDNTMDFNDKGKENKGYIQLLMEKYPPKPKKSRKKKKEDKEEPAEDVKTEKE
jgi:SNF2 family DNA or RNA helicase